MRWDKDYVALAAARRQIVAGFNIFGHEDAGAVIRAAERLGAPVMLMVNRDARKALDIECWGRCSAQWRNGLPYRSPSIWTIPAIRKTYAGPWQAALPR